MWTSSHPNAEAVDQGLRTAGRAEMATIARVDRLQKTVQQN
jgi:hypothetical protein